MLELLLALLVPAAAYGGWWMARTLSSRTEAQRNRRFSNRYFQGLNYLLNEQPDKAIAVFLEMAEINKDTFETHLALGSLFRRRGEVDRAIRLHQNIISKQSLDDSQRTKALLELGEDYMRAGLFDRAERLFSEMTERGAHAPSALRHLLDIYQQEKDWDKALEMARRLEELTGESMGQVSSHFCCELAEKALQAGQFETARKHLRQARRQDPGSVRAHLVLARIAQGASAWDEAMAACEEVATMNGDYIPDLLDDYLACAEAADQGDRATASLHDWCKRYGSISVILRLTSQIQAREGVAAATNFLAGELARNPSVRGLDKLIELKLAGGPDLPSGDDILRAVAQKLLARQPTHRCANCGYSGNSNYWQCPSCKHWGSTRTIHGVLGD